MEYKLFDLAGQEGIIVVLGGNIEDRQERVASNAWNQIDR
jgi:hypothetical protein